MTFDNLYNEMAYLKYEFVYGTYDFSQQKIIWDILYNYIVSLHHECFGVCVFSSFESKNDLGHSLHWNGFSLVWVWVKWIFKLLETENDLEWKWNGLSFKWILRLTTRPSI